jgi:excisionase family DNA binding protein
MPTNGARFEARIVDNRKFPVSNRLTLKQCATIANVSFPTLRRWIDRHELSVIRIGRVVRVNSDDLESFLNAHRVDAEAR